MSRWLDGIAAVVTVGLIAGSSGDGLSAALDRAAFQWDKGNYVAALEAYQTILQGPDAQQALESIALQTGELYQSIELTTDGANPVFAPDGRRFAFETGSSNILATENGAERATHIRTTDQPDTDAGILPGGNVSFCPDGRHVAYVKTERTPEIAQAEAALATAARAERAAHLQALTRAIARASQLRLSNVTGGNDDSIAVESFRGGPVLCGADGIFYSSGGEDEARSQISLARNGAPPQTFTTGDGLKTPLRTDLAGRTLVFSTIGTAASSGTDGRLPTSFSVLTSDRRVLPIDGRAPALSRDGAEVAWISRDRGASDVGDERLMVASTTGAFTPTVVRKGPERLDAPAISPDGARIAFQMMPRDDWEIYVIGRDGADEARVTREIQHDVLPQFLSDTRLLAAIGEPRHRRSYVYDLPSMRRTRVFHNNTVRTIAPEYTWVASGDGSKILIVAERDGNTVSPDRGVYLMDLASTVSLQNLRARVAADLKAERALRAEGQRMFAPIADTVRRVVSEISAGRAYSYEKALFDFDSKHISKPGNKRASEYLFNTYKSFGYEPEYQWFSPRSALGGQTANVVATLKGTVNPELVYVVSSHYDSVAVGPGADDDSSGTAALLEAARALAGHPMPATIIFASFTGEEAGLLGSREFVRRAVQDKLKIVGALNNDMIGWANDDRLDDTIRYSNPGIRDVQHGAAIEFTNLITYDALYYKSTDAAAYYEAYGDIVGGIGSYPVLGNPHYHQPHDLLEGINHQLVAEVGKTTAATLVLLASSPSRIGGLQAAASAHGASLSWTPSPETGVTGYIVTWGPADNPSLHTLRVTQPSATLPGASAGTHVQVKAVNAKGLEGWDWARGVVKQ
jgi:hypothetical protein